MHTHLSNGGTPALVAGAIDRAWQLQLAQGNEQEEHQPLLLLLGAQPCAPAAGGVQQGAVQGHCPIHLLHKALREALKGL